MLISTVMSMFGVIFKNNIRKRKKTECEKKRLKTTKKILINRFVRERHKTRTSRSTDFFEQTKAKATCRIKNEETTKEINAFTNPLHDGPSEARSFRSQVM